MGLGAISFLIIVANLIVSYNGFNNRRFYNSNVFQVEKILVRKEYKRLITSGFLHVNWWHLLFNMFTLYAFGNSLESYIGELQYFLIYFAGLVGGNLLSLFIHRDHPDYRSVGASGAVAGVVFGSIALFPGMEIGFFGLPLSIPAWLYGLAYMLISIYGIKSRRDNIGHDAHLGGAMVGMLIAILIQPSALVQNYITILIISVPALAFLFIIIKRPQLLLVDNLFYRNHEDFYSIDHKYNQERANRQREIDRILEKIHKKGMKSLTREEKELLKRQSKSIR